MADHAKANTYALTVFGRDMITADEENLRAAYIELQKLAKTTLKYFDPDCDWKDVKALRAAIGEE